MTRGWDFPPDDFLEDIEGRTEAAEDLARHDNYQRAATYIEPARRSIDGAVQLPLTDIPNATYLEHTASQVYAVAGNVQRQLAGEAYLDPSRDPEIIAMHLNEAERLLRLATEAGKRALLHTTAGFTHASLKTRTRTERAYAGVDLKIARLALAKFIILRDWRAHGELRRGLNQSQQRFEDWNDAVGFVSCRALVILAEQYISPRPIFSSHMLRNITSFWKDIRSQVKNDTGHSRTAYLLAIHSIGYLALPRDILGRHLLMDF